MKDKKLILLLAGVFALTLIFKYLGTNLSTILQVLIFWVLIFGTLFFCIRKYIAQSFQRIKLPVIVKYYIILTPIILIEEAFSIQPPYFWRILPILFGFYVFFFVIYLFQKITRANHIITTLFCMILSWPVEFLLAKRIQQVQGFTLILMSVLGFLIYAVMMFLPAYYLEHELKLRKENRPRLKT